MTNRLIREKYKLNLEIQKLNQVRFGTKSLGYLGSKVWNSLDQCQPPKFSHLVCQ